MNGTDREEPKKFDANKALDILKWLMFDQTTLDREDGDYVGSVLIFLCEKLEPIYDKYQRRNSDDNNQTSAQQ